MILHPEFKVRFRLLEEASRQSPVASCQCRDGLIINLRVSARRRKFFRWIFGQNFLGRGEVPLQHTKIPSRHSDAGIGIETRWNFVKDFFAGSEITGSKKFDIGKTELGIDVVRLVFGSNLAQTL